MLISYLFIHLTSNEKYMVSFSNFDTFLIVYFPCRGLIYVIINMYAESWAISVINVMEGGSEGSQKKKNH